MQSTENEYFKNLKRSKSAPKQSKVDDCDNNSLLVRSYTPLQSVDCFGGFNRAKSHLFHSCRLPKSKPNQSYNSKTVCNGRLQNFWTSWSRKTSHTSKKKRTSIISTADTIETAVSSDDESIKSNTRRNYEPTFPHCQRLFSVDTTSKDSIIKESDDDASLPKRPPRAYPYFFNATDLVNTKRKHTSSLCIPKDKTDGSDIASFNSINTTSLTSSMNSQFSQSPDMFDKYKFTDYSSDFRIYPVIQNGVKMSDTHYWLMNSPKSSLLAKQNKLQQCSIDFAKANHKFSIECDLDRSGDCQLNTCLTRLHTVQHYANIPLYSACSSPGYACDVQSNKTEKKMVNLRRGRSENSKEYLQKLQKNLIPKLKLLVPQATENECQAVLIGSSWNFDGALKRLKLELLCRMGILSKQDCQKVLEHLNWNLENAMHLIKHKNKFYHNRTNFSSLAYDPQMANDREKHLQEDTCTTLSGIAQLSFDFNFMKI